MECSENTVKSRLNYGRKNLRVKAEELQKKGSNIVLVGYSKSGEMTLPMSLVLDKELTFKTVFRYRRCV